MSHDVECLRCGELRLVGGRLDRTGAHGECPRCGYVGWASPSKLTETERRLLRLRPPERRRLYAV
jgi:DNA-directed RNA polymerase subunit RPC12/RpoP